MSSIKTQIKKETRWKETSEIYPVKWRFQPACFATKKANCRGYINQIWTFWTIFGQRLKSINQTDRLTDTNWFTRTYPRRSYYQKDFLSIDNSKWPPYPGGCPYLLRGGFFPKLSKTRFQHCSWSLRSLKP